MRFHFTRPGIFFFAFFFLPALQTNGSGSYSEAVFN